jgi:hypothetical protein
VNRRVRIVAFVWLVVATFAANGFPTHDVRQAAAATTQVAAQLVSYERGYVLLTGGELFKTAPNLAVLDAAGTPAKSKPRLGDFVRLTFDQTGLVTEMAIGDVPFASGTPLTAVARFSLLAPPAQPTGPTLTELRNERMRVAFVVQVPTTTLPGDAVYMETGETGWNALAIRLDRIDTQHFRVVLDVPLGSPFRYLYSRGNSQSTEHGTNGLQRPPRALLVRDLKGQLVQDKVEHWGDEAGDSTLSSPQTTPSPFNPAPYPNLPPVKINPLAPR